MTKGHSYHGANGGAKETGNPGRQMHMAGGGAGALRASEGPVGMEGRVGTGRSETQREEWQS